MRRLTLISLVCVLPLCAQDAGMVLRTSVGYNTQRLSLPLNDEQKKAAEQFGQQAQQENRVGHFAEAMRAYQHGTAAMHSVEWTPPVEFASALQGKLDHAMLEPGRKVTISLSALYPVDRASAEKDKINATVVLVAATRGNESPRGSESPMMKNVAAATPVDSTKLPFYRRDHDSRRAQRRLQSRSPIDVAGWKLARRIAHRIRQGAADSRRITPLGCR